MFYPTGGHVYVYKAPEHVNSAEEPWKEDGCKWKCVGTQHLPKGKKSQIRKESFNLYTKVRLFPV